METNKILSFEEFATRGNDTATSTADTSTADATSTGDTATADAEATVDTDVETDAETTTDTETETTDTETEETEDDVEESEDVENVKTVAEMVEDLKNGLINEATAWANDEYSEHTTTSYLKENASLVAATTCNALEELNADKDGYTKESYEATLNEIKEAYAKKIDECMEAFGSTEEVEKTENTEDAVIATPAK
tara:strand:- start:169 stop:753 length:585 start_codon:yes stop_codon:yes gene_type:complete